MTADEELTPTMIAIRAVQAQALRDAADAWVGRDNPPWPLKDPVYRFLRERADWLDGGR